MELWHEGLAAPWIGCASASDRPPDTESSDPIVKMGDLGGAMIPGDKGCAQAFKACSATDLYLSHGFEPAPLMVDQLCAVSAECESLAGQLSDSFFMLEKRGPVVADIDRELDRRSGALQWLKSLSTREPQLYAQVAGHFAIEHRLFETRCRASTLYGRFAAATGFAMCGSHESCAILVAAVMERLPLDPDQILSAFSPPTKVYSRLVEAAGFYGRLAQEGGFPAVPYPFKGKKGTGHIEALRARLSAEGFEAGTAPDVHDSALSKALASFQAMHALPQSGRVDKETKKALAITPQEKYGRIVLALRALRQSIPPGEPSFVHVQVPHAFLELYVDGTFLKKYRTVVGSARKDRKKGRGPKEFLYRTLPIDSMIELIVINPEWKVPDSIAEREIVPKLTEDPDYLENNNYRVVTYPCGRELYIQEAGPGNALGAVKFMFFNDYGYYLHDTPGKGLFRKNQRLFSHGCIRVENALELAATLLMKDRGVGWDYVLRQRRSGKPKEIYLQVPVPIHVTYNTAGADSSGGLYFMPDYYQLEDLLPELERIRMLGVLKGMLSWWKQATPSQP